MEIAIADITIPEGRRPLNPTKVEEIAASIKVVGLLSPIGVQALLSLIDGSTSYKLAYGRHRLEACRLLGSTEVEAVVVGEVCPEDVRLDDATVEMMEIAENLHRAELTTSERNEHLARWVALLEKRQPNSDAKQPSSKPGPKPSAAVAKAAKMSGLTPKTVKEAIKATKVSPKVKAAADKAELTSKQRLAVSRRAGEDQQLKAVAEFAAPNTRSPGDPAKYDDVGADRQRVDQLHAMLKAFAALEKLGDAGQVAEAILRLDVGDPVPRLLRVAAFATSVVKIMNSRLRSSTAAAAGGAS